MTSPGQLVRVLVVSSSNIDVECYHFLIVPAGSPPPSAPTRPDNGLEIRSVAYHLRSSMTHLSSIPIGKRSITCRISVTQNTLASLRPNIFTSWIYGSNIDSRTVREVGLSVC